jgi:hypothetical protein
MLHGDRGQWYKHYTGVRQSDPLSPMLFILAMEPLQRMFQIATTDGLLSPINNIVDTLRASMYADDATVFLQPIKEDVFATAKILEIFGHASGLVTNRDKCVVYPIQSHDVNMVEVGFTEPVGTGPVRLVPGGTDSARYTNRSGSHPKPCLKFLNLNEPPGLTGLPSGFFEPCEPVFPRFWELWIEVMEGFQCLVQSFPCNYLGLPLHFKQLRQVEVQPLIHKMSNRLPTWKGRFLNRASRLKS